MEEPSYLYLHREGKLEQRIAEVLDLMKSCRLCPRFCGVNRVAGETGFCRTGSLARVASFHAHFGEEAPLVGSSGSGTIFFSSCNLLCSFCQNYDISHLAEGAEVKPEELAAMMMRLSRQGCHNINFVTPTHVVPQILQALPLAIEGGLHVPLVFNCGGYELVSTLRILEGIIDIYMPDFKFWDERWAHRFCGVSDYRARAAEAIREMHRQVGDLIVDERGVARRGLLVRHLVMPNDVAGTEEVVKFLAREISVDTYVNVMAQYRPCGKAHDDTFIGRGIAREEYNKAVQEAVKAGLTRLD